ncbi:hypothetical protein [Patulibacter americanus]|uniref:hypothetical protein n=1 Tax=Patulibacter americanus TaxID=588672 RepID=UPI0003B4BCB8|nr:hypothetical protein [Patulibacter americanus]
MTASRRRTRAQGLAVATAIGITAVAALPSAASAAESPRCDATTLQLQLLGGDVIAPIRANPKFTPCADDTKAVANVPSLLGIVGVQAVSASTKVDTTKQATSESRIAGAKIGITGPLSDALTGPLLNGPNSIVGQVDGALNGILGQLNGAGGPLSGLLSALFPTTANGAPLTAGLTSNLAGALQAALPDVLNADVINATAQAKCVNGRGQLSGASQIAGLRILGTTVDVNDATNRVLSIDTAALNLGKLVSVDDVLRGIQLSGGGLADILSPILGRQTNLYDILHTTDPSVLGSLNTVLLLASGGQLSVGKLLDQVTAVIQPILNQVNINLPPGLLRAQIVPKTQTTTGELLTQQTVGLSVSVLGQPVVGGTLAQARVSTAAAGCNGDGNDDVAGAGAIKDPDKFSSPEAEAVLQCSNRPAQLIDVYGSRGRTYVQGVAVRKFVGKTAAIYTRDGNKRVGSAKIRKTGLFSTRVPLPRASVRNTNTARYYAVVGGKKTRALKFARRMNVLSLTTRKGKVTMKGQVVAPRFSSQPTVLIKQRVTCKRYKKVARVNPDARGNFTVTFKAPSKKLGAAIYRAETSVPANEVSTKSFRTYTLPRPVGL